MTMEDLKNKFNSLASNKFSDSELLELKELIFNCDEHSARDFMNKLVLK